MECFPSLVSSFFLFYYFYFTASLAFLQIFWTQLEIHRAWLLLLSFTLSLSFTLLYLLSFTLDPGMASVHQLWYIRSVLLPDQYNSPVCLLRTIPPLNGVLPCTAGIYGCFISSFEALAVVTFEEDGMARWQLAFSDIIVSVITTLGFSLAMRALLEKYTFKCQKRKDLCKMFGNVMSSVCLARPSETDLRLSWVNPA